MHQLHVKLEKNYILLAYKLDLGAVISIGYKQ